MAHGFDNKKGWDVMDTQKRLHENISALADGELAVGEIELAFATLSTADGQVAWDAYHLIGHTLRSDGCGSELSVDFCTRLAARLAPENPLRHSLGGRRSAPREGGQNGDAAASDGAAAAASMLSS